MRIDGQNPNITIGQAPNLALLAELNLKDGQKVIGRIISLTAGEALLDLAGKVLTAKVEGNPPFMSPGSAVLFRVNADTQGKIQLKVLNPVAENLEPAAAAAVSSLSSPAGGPSAQSADKGIQSIITALVKSDLPILSENIAKIARIVQNFQTKYHLPLEAETVAFVMAQKWPETDGVLLTALLLQNRNIRNQLWNSLQQMSDEYPEIAETLAALKLNMEQDAVPILEKMLIMDHQGNTAFEAGRVSETEPQPANPGLINGSAENERNESQQIVAEHGSSGHSMVSGNATSKSGEMDNPGAAFLKNGSIDHAAGSKGLETDNPVLNGKVIGPTAKGGSGPMIEGQPGLGKDPVSEAPPQKIYALLEQNFDLQKALHQSPDGMFNLIPLLVRDSQNNLHECFVEWRSESRKQGKKNGDQYLSLIVPTEHMGLIRMTVGIGSRTKINLKVASPEVKEFMTRHSEALRASITSSGPVTISLDLEQAAEPQFNGVDLKL